MSQITLKLLNHLEKTIAYLEPSIKKRNLKKTEFGVRELGDFSSFLKELLPEDFVKDNFGDFNRHLRFMEHFLKKRDFEWIQSNFDDIKERDFPSIKSKIYSLAEVEKSPRRKLALSKKVFIVHGRDHEPMKELKTMLYEFGLNPIVLHEEASGGLTLPEKLERHAKDVGYAFAILTPDDIGGEKATIRKRLGDGLPLHLIEPSIINRMLDGMLNNFEPRARQNVIFEMGYFWGLLERKKVCCLLKGDVEKPSDMEGIVYISFKDSVYDVQVKIMKELKEAGYEIKL
jgi:predicted nucleotide-binding protein